MGVKPDDSTPLPETNQVSKPIKSREKGSGGKWAFGAEVYGEKEWYA